MRLKLTSRKLTERLKQIASSFSGQQVAAVLELSPDLSWVYYQEFGTATKFEPGDYNGYIPPSTKPEGYEIYPVSGGAIRLPATALHPEETIIPHIGPPFTDLHPGVTPKHFVRSALKDIQAQASDALITALQRSEYDAGAMISALLNEVMPTVKATIANSIGDALSQNRADGKLSGQSPAQMFEAGASIREA